MAKFSALTSADLRTNARNIGRLARKVGYVVFVEADDGSWFELDAESIAHSKVLADTQVDKMNARGASCWLVNHINGKIKRKAFYMVFPEINDDLSDIEI